MEEVVRNAYGEKTYKQVESKLPKDGFHSVKINKFGSINRCIPDDDVKVDPDKKYFPDDINWKDNYKYSTE